MVADSENTILLDEAPVVDGRRLRGERNREGVIEAILDLLDEGVERPTTTQIAERSGVSVRSVFRHFDDVESLYAAAVDAHTVRVAPMYPLPPLTGTVEQRVAGLVDHRAALYGAMGVVRRVAERLRTSSPSIAEKLELSRRVLRRQLQDVFDPELGALGVAERRTLVDALEAATSWHAWESLTLAQGCPVPRAAAAMRQMAGALLQQP
jgi:AcrR family transcriptional regulator